MRFALSLVLAGLFAVTAPAQVEPPKNPVKPIKKAVKKFKAVAPTTVKAGDHIVVDASSAAGKIEFLFDGNSFPKERATLRDKILVLSTSVNGSYAISVVSYEDATTERIIVKVTGGEDPTPGPKPPPVPTDPIEALRVEVQTGFAKTTEALASLAARVSALEGSKPPPPPPPPPIPSDQIAAAIQLAYQKEFAADKKDSATKMAACYQAAHDLATTAKSWGELSAEIRAKATSLGVTGKLPAVSAAINAQLLSAGFPASPSVLMGPGDAGKARTTLAKVIAALNALP